jgi:hypothetical protein
MKKKQFIAAISSSALASGMAQGAILYSGPVNSALPATASFPDVSTNYDMNADGIGDFYVGFDGFSGPNDQKPYIEGYDANVPGSAPLASYDTNTSSWGLQVTPFGTMIDSNYLAADPTKAYFWQDGGAHYVGEWNNTAITEGYVGMELWDSSGNTNFGWVRLIYDGVDSPKSLTVVDYGYETTPFTGIIAGATNEVGAPDIYVQPQSQTNAVGASVQFNVTYLANPPPTLQWMTGPTNGHGPYTPLSDGGIILGSSTATLTINGATAANAADYIVVISNSLGSVTSSPPATLTVVAPVVTPAQPILFGGVTGNFYVTVTGGLTPTYQWRHDTTNLSDGGRIAGATTGHLQISNLQTTDAGNYDVLLNFGSGPAPSVVSSLTVLPVAQESLYDAAVLAAAPVAYYRLNESGNPATSNLVAYDNAGGFNGVYGIDVTNGFAGVKGPDAADGFPGFAANNAAVLITPYDTNSWITLAPWNLNTNSVTFTAWVNPSAPPNSQAGVVYAGTTSSTDAGIDYYWETNSAGEMQLSYAWNEGPGNDEDLFFQSDLVTPTNEWSFVAVAVTSSNATLYMFNAEATNSAVDESYLAGIFDPNGSTNLVMPFNSPEYIGSDPAGASFGAENFTGTIGAVAIFNQTLTSNQLQTLYNAATGVLPPVNLQIAVVGTQVQVTWPMGSLLQATNLKGPWTTNYLASSPYLVTPTGSGSMFYRVVVP